MQMSGADMRFYMKKISVTIEPSTVMKQRMTNLIRTVAEICRMDSGDMSDGFKKTSRNRKQATRNHAKLIASIILTILLKDKSDFIGTDKYEISWNEEKEKRLWKHYGVKHNTRSITRLDIFIYRLLMDDAMSIQHWISTAESWEINKHDNDDDKYSNLEYDPIDLIPTGLDNVKKKEKQVDSHEKEKRKAFSALFAGLPCCRE